MTSFLPLCTHVSYLYFAICSSVLNLFPDIDECLSDPCSVNGNCTNVAGSFICACTPGYSGDGLNCAGMYVFDLYVRSYVSGYLFTVEPPKHLSQASYSSYCLCFKCM